MSALICPSVRSRLTKNSSLTKPCWVNYLYFAWYGSLETEPRLMYRKNRESVILTLFGSSPKTRILDLFLDNPLFEFTRNEIIEALGMAKSTLYSTLPGVEETRVIVETRQIGKASLYRLNSESPVVQDLRGLIRRYAKANAQNETAIDSTVFEEEKRRALLA